MADATPFGELRLNDTLKLRVKGATLVRAYQTIQTEQQMLQEVQDKIRMATQQII